MKNAIQCICALWILALVSACTGQFPNATRTLVGVSGYGITLELLSSSASAPAQGVESEVHVGRWASSAKRGTVFNHGQIQQPGPAPTSWTAVTGGVGVITVARIEAIPATATTMLWSSIDTTTQTLVNTGNSTLTGLVTGRTYKVRAAWFNGTVRVSEWSEATLVAAG